MRDVPHRVLTAFYWLKLKAVNGIIYGGHDVRKEEKFDWKRRTFYQRMSSLMAHGLCERDQAGNYRLTRLGVLIAKHNDGKTPRHKCTLKLNRDMSEQDVSDMLYLKLIEEKHRHIHWFNTNTNTKDHDLNKGIPSTLKGFNESIRMELRGKGFESISASVLAAHMGVSVNTYHTIAKRLEGKGLLTRIARITRLEGVTKSMMKYGDTRQAGLGGAMFTVGGMVFLRQPSYIRTNVGYQRPIPQTPLFQNTPQ